MIMGEEQADAGDFKVGQSVVVRYCYFGALEMRGESKLTYLVTSKCNDRTSITANVR